MNIICVHVCTRSTGIVRGDTPSNYILPRQCVMLASLSATLVPTGHKEQNPFWLFICDISKIKTDMNTKYIFLIISGATIGVLYTHAYIHFRILVQQEKLLNSFKGVFMTLDLEALRNAEFSFW